MNRRVEMTLFIQGSMVFLAATFTLMQVLKDHISTGSNIIRIFGGAALAVILPLGIITVTVLRRGRASEFTPRQWSFIDITSVFLLIPWVFSLILAGFLVIFTLAGGGWLD